MLKKSFWCFFQKAPLVFLAVITVAATAQAADWTPKICGDEPAPPGYDLSSRAGYNASVIKANAYLRTARDYATCILRAAHDDETTVSRAAQDRIADIQATAVGKQQAIYAKLTAQSDRFRQAAARLQARQEESK